MPSIMPRFSINSAQCVSTRGTAKKRERGKTSFQLPNAFGGKFSQPPRVYGAFGIIRRSRRKRRVLGRRRRRRRVLGRQAGKWVKREKRLRPALR